MGDGYISNHALEGVKAAAKKGIIIIRSSRVGNGIATREKTDDDNNFVTTD